MKEVFTMWKYTKMVVLVAVSAAFYAALTIPLKGIPIIPGYTELRPGAVVPVVFGLLFGPAGAWGAAFGNVIGDFFGTFGIGTIFGFFGNFFYGFLAYKVWTHMGLAQSADDLQINSWKKVVNFGLVVVLSSLACGLIIAWGLEGAKLVPFLPVGPIISVNNMIACLILGIPLLGLLHARLNRWDLLWSAIMEQADNPPGPTPKLGTALVWGGVLGGFITGIALSLGIGVAIIPQVGSGALSPVALGVAPFLIIVLVGSLLI
ncbi:MAG: QueT transporter family protein [Candidatus Abyssobacteria bacterium SURF_5]|uniref:QueT transporter family protein n=1 Tax=Abyssobacteria bacterium (strain SURF_5) TaxID=2093360 RepID=A0A3A4P469_ABYX5|nr:MAG: QueT transporter family protein [Candidatus Abyssubacteria bacterium SURF_5]